MYSREEIRSLMAAAIQCTECSTPYCCEGGYVVRMHLTEAQDILDHYPDLVAELGDGLKEIDFKQPCPFLRDGRCQVYEYAPWTCVIYGVWKGEDPCNCKYEKAEGCRIPALIPDMKYGPVDIPTVNYRTAEHESQRCEERGWHPWKMGMPDAFRRVLTDDVRNHTNVELTELVLATKDEEEFDELLSGLDGDDLALVKKILTEIEATGST